MKALVDDNVEEIGIYFNEATDKILHETKDKLQKFQSCVELC